ncbi:MAG: DUF6580 family putative transport protein [Candidatus Berkelbacteria bacterium]
MAYFIIIAAAFIRIATHFSTQAPFDAIVKFIPNLPNFAPIAAIALFSSVYLNKKYALIIPVVTMIISDLFIGFYNPWLMAAVYGSFVLIGLIGLWVKNNKTVTNVIGATLTGSVLFFLLTNFVMWAIQPYMPAAIYPQTLQGLVDCYTMGLPFFRNTLAGDIFYVGAMFGLMEVTIYIKNKIWQTSFVKNI